MEAPQTPRIGIAPETIGDNEVVKLNDRRLAKPRFRDQRPSAETIIGFGDQASATVERKIVPDPEPAPQIIIPGGDFIPEGPTVRMVDHRGEAVSSLTWPKYLAWRKTKCRPFDYERGPAEAVNPGSTHGVRGRALEEIDQAILEFVGEVAELGTLLLQNGPTAFLEGEIRTKLIDECGDILFCGAWALDAWGRNPLVEADDLELLRVTDESELAAMAQAFIVHPPKVVLSNGRFMALLQGVVLRFMLEAQSMAGLLCNSFKKLKYQRREQNVDEQIARIAGTLLIINQILIIANSSVEEALQVNQRKLNARYPDGYVAGQGGGIRTGDGK